MKILAILSNFGYWGEELIGPLEVLDDQGIEVVFASPKGGKPRALPPSMDSKYIDPPLGRTVVSETMAKKVVAMDNSDRLNETISIENWMPERPYMSSNNYLREFEEYNLKLEEIESELDRYAGLLIVGGSGPIADMVNNQRVHDIILSFYKKNKPIAAECYGVACLIASIGQGNVY